MSRGGSAHAAVAVTADAVTVGAAAGSAAAGSAAAVGAAAVGAAAPEGSAAVAGATGWVLLPTLVVRSAGFGWHLLDGLRHRSSTVAADRLAAALDQADQVRERLLGEMSSGVRLTRGQTARLRNHRPLPSDAPLPARARREWDAAAAVVEWAQREWESAEALDEVEAAAAVAALAQDPRVLEAVVCSSPGVYRDLARGVPSGARLRRQLASYLQRLATKCETMSVFGPVNYARLDPAVAEPAVLSWKGPAVWTDRRAYLSAWAFDALLAGVLAEPGAAEQVVPRRCTFAGSPRGELPTAVLTRAADGVRTLGELATATGLTAEQARSALDDAVQRGLLTHDLVPPAVLVDQTRWLAARLVRRESGPGGAAGAGAPAIGRLVPAVLGVLDRYPGADAATKLLLQGELHRLLGPGAGERERPAGPERKFYNDRVVVTEAAAGTLELTVGGGLAGDLQQAVPAALDLLAGAALSARRRANAALARDLGPGRFPLTRVVRDRAESAVAGPSRLTLALQRLLADGRADAADLDLRDLDPRDLDLGDADPRGGEPAGPGSAGGEPAELPVLCSADVMVVAHDLARYRAGETLLVIGDVHDAALLTDWALQFHPDAAAALADRDRQIERALGQHRAIGLIARRRTGLPPLRFPGPVVELGTVEGPAERLPLDRLEVHSDGRTARLRQQGDPRDLFLHNGELDTSLQTALALPRVRPLAVPDLPHVPRVRWGNVVLSRRRWRLRPGPLDQVPEGPAGARERAQLREALRRLGVPVRFFAKASHQRKPVFVDLDSPLLVDVLHRLADGAERVHASEVLPDRDGSWLRDGDTVVAAELRCVYLRSTAQEGPR